MNARYMFFICLMFGNFTMSNAHVEIYPMPVYCTLTVPNITKSAYWYDKALHFKTIFTLYHPITNEPLFMHLRREKYQDILLVQESTPATNSACCITVTFQAYHDIDRLTQEALNYDAVIVAQPHNTPWNTREATIQDLDGYRITFTQVIDSQQNMDTTIHAMLNQP